MKTITLRETIPSTSHNAPFSPEHGNHWPAGQQFELLSKKKADSIRKWRHVPKDRTIIQQIGGEEVIVTIPNDRMQELFGVEPGNP